MNPDGELTTTEIAEAHARKCKHCKRAITDDYIARLERDYADEQGGYFWGQMYAAFIAGFCSGICEYQAALEVVSGKQAWWQRKDGQP